MTWLVGIDEAGYGPNLGPLVQAAAAIRVDDPEECLWAKHSDTVCRATDPHAGRIIIDDSKLVHVGANKFERLQANLQRALGHLPDVDEISVGESTTDLQQEAWYSRRAGSVSDRRSGSLPQSVDDNYPRLSIAFVRSVVTPTPRLNQLIDRHGTKAGPLAAGVTTLLQAVVAELPDHPISIVIDKQGGRNYYAPLISSAFPDGWVRVLGEAGNCSNYIVEGLQQNIRLTFRPKAERHCLPVAVASMMAKYVRESLMHQFNRYWLEHVPGLQPTAGYPTDAKRFYSSILPAMKRLKLSPDQVWRKK